MENKPRAAEKLTSFQGRQVVLFFGGCCELRKVVGEACWQEVAGEACWQKVFGQACWQEVGGEIYWQAVAPWQFVKIAHDRDFLLQGQ